MTGYEGFAGRGGRFQTAWGRWGEYGMYERARGQSGHLSGRGRESVNGQGRGGVFRYLLTTHL